MAKNLDLSFVMPAKNEAESVPTLYNGIINQVKKLKKTYEIIFVDDGSTDSSFEIMKSLRNKDKNVKIIRLRGNFGKSVALQSGFEKATGKIVFTMDVDLQDDPKEIPKFLKKVNKGFDLVSGWKKNRHDPISKTFPSKVVNFVTRTMTGLHIHDINCGFKAYRQEVVKSLNLYGDLYRFIPIFAHRQNYKVGEITVKHNPRKFGKSKYGWRRFISGWLDLLTVFFLIRYLKRPGHFFGSLGFVSFGTGFLIGLYITYLRVITGSIQYRHPLLFFGILLMIIGIQLITTGLLAEMIINVSQKDKTTKAYIREYLG